MKTAVIVAGLCRHTLLPKKTWNIFPFETDWYMSTWDIKKSTYEKEFSSSIDEIYQIKDKFKHIEIHNFESYYKEYIDTYILPVYCNFYYLVSKLRDKILNENYERIIITRSDLYFDKIEELSDRDFYVDDSTVILLGINEPFIDHEKQEAGDLLIGMNKSVFEKFSHLEYIKHLSKNNYNVHNYVYNFFKFNHLNVQSLSKIRGVVIRPEAEEYAKENPNYNFWDLLKIFGEVYYQRDEKFGGDGKFFKKS